MYGLLLDSIQKFICEQYGERYWNIVRRRANLKNQWFVTHEVYSDSLMQILVDAAAEELGQDRGTVMCMFGKYFAENIGRYGYARLLRVLGRDLRDFLNGLDDLHEYLRFSYPKMRPPSFFCECETVNGLKLHYTTKRRGYLQYVIGQLQTVGRIYGKEVEVSVISEEFGETGTTHIVLDLKFDNVEFLQEEETSTQLKHFSVDSLTFLGVFPFCLLLNRELEVLEVGSKLRKVLPQVAGQHLVDCFTIRKPMLDAITWKEISLHANCVFELVSNTAVVRRGSKPDNFSPGMEYQTPPPSLRLKGQMLILADQDVLAFLSSPVMDSPEDLYESGIFVNDLSMHDSSRDIILAGSQKDPELTLALSQEKIRSAQLEESIQQMDRILFQMIPKPIAMQLRNGETALNTCKEFSSVSILFSDIVSFTPMCSRLHPMEVVCVLNAMYVAFDHLCEVHHVYKTETIGDAYMAICGAPVYTVHHAEYITDFAISIIKATSKINDPSTNKSLKIRVGIHTGHVVAGVVGSTVLRYDVFGDTVNVAARMEATGEPMRIHVSEATAERLMGTAFIVKERGCVNVKGKGNMKTFWVTGKQSLPDVPEEEDQTKHLMMMDQECPLPSTAAEASDRTVSLQLPGSARSSPVTSPPLISPPSTPSPTRMSPPHPIHIQPSSSPCPLSPVNRQSGRNETSLASLSSKLSRSASPKPSEWPQAEHQLQKFESIALDNSVPPGGRRRKTMPAVTIEKNVLNKQSHRRKSAEVSSKMTTNTTIPLEQLQQTTAMAEQSPPQASLPPYLTQWPNLWGQRSVNGYNMEQMSPLSADRTGGSPLTAPIPPPGAPFTSITPSKASTLLRQDTVTMHRDAGDMCVKHWGGTNSFIPVKATGLTLNQLQRFAAEAEVNACQARQLADQAADLVLRVQWAERNRKRASKEGTSVDLECIDLAAACPIHLEPEESSDTRSTDALHSNTKQEAQNDRTTQDQATSCTII